MIETEVSEIELEQVHQDHAVEPEDRSTISRPELDIDKYLAGMEEEEHFSEKEKIDYLRALWHIMNHIVELNLDLDLIPSALLGKTGIAPGDSVNSVEKKSNQSSFNNIASDEGRKDSHDG